MLLSRDRDGRRDLATPPGPSHSLRRIDLSEAKLDINSWSEFPPMHNQGLFQDFASEGANAKFQNSRGGGQIQSQGGATPY